MTALNEDERRELARLLVEGARKVIADRRAKEAEDAERIRREAEVLAPVYDEIRKIAARFHAEDTARAEKSE